MLNMLESTTLASAIWLLKAARNTVNYIEFSEEYNVEKHIGDLYIATKLEKDD